MKAVIFDNRIEFDGVNVRVDDLLDEDFYNFSDEKSKEFVNDTYAVNEVYDHLIHHYFAIQRWVATNHPEMLNVRYADIKFKFYAKDICTNNKVRIKGFGILDKIKVWSLFHLSVLSSAIYFAYRLLLIPYKPEIVSYDKFAVVRTKAAIKKFKKFTEIPQEIESFFDKNSIYRLFPKGKRIKWVVQAYCNALRTFHEMDAFYRPLLGQNFKYALMDFYKKRIVYADLYKLMMDDYLSHFEGKEFYSGNNLDRYSVIEDQLCKKYCIKSYNIPHGIEYGFKFPKGFSSDVFYVHSQFTADYLNRLYNTSKFVFDESIIRRMFEYGYDKPHEKMIIFFTEPREVEVNIEIVDALLPKMKEKGLKLYLKLHPGDSMANYKELDVDYIKDYELSLTGNVCISRKSTILLEAIYNHSVPVAIITNKKDETMFKLFPSLNAKEIIKTYNVDDLFDVIVRNV